MAGPNHPIVDICEAICYNIQMKNEYKPIYDKALENLRNELRQIKNYPTIRPSDIINTVATDKKNEADSNHLKVSTPSKIIVSGQKIEKPQIQEEAEKDLTQNSSSLLSRRKFLIGGGLAATGFGLGYLTKFKLPDLGKLLPFQENEQPKPGTMVLGNEEKVFQNEMIGYASWTPDGPITYYETASGKRRYLLTGGQDNATYMLESDGKKTLKEIMASSEINENSFKKVYGPDANAQYRREYAGITGILQIDKSNKDHLLGVAHCEERTSRDASGDYTSTIGLTESFDGGLTWEDKGPLIVGTDVKAPGGGRVSGAGQPSVVLNEKDGYAYIMYIDWSAKGKHPDQLYLARAKTNDNGTLGQIEYYTKNGFSDFKPEELKPVIPVPESSDFIYTALPHLSWNTELKQYICEGESDTGFWMATSPDLLNWSKPEIVYDFSQRGGKPHSILKAGEKWDSYPTALDESKPNSQITGKNGIFYHSSGDNIVPHVPAAVNFEIK